MRMPARHRSVAEAPDVTVSSTRARLVSAVLVAGGLGLAGLGVGLATPASADPGGNNGTVKISEVPIDNVPDNDPHVGCQLHVQWYGFDEGATSKIAFELVSPTTGTVTVDGPLTVDVGADPAGGGKDADADVVYTMHPDAIPHPEQGFHEKITVTTTFSNGSETKSKVIWFKDCTGQSPTPCPSSSPSPTPSDSVPSDTPTPTPSDSVPTDTPTSAGSTPTPTPGQPTTDQPTPTPTPGQPTPVVATSDGSTPTPTPGQPTPVVASATPSAVTAAQPGSPSSTPPAGSAVPPSIIDAGLAGNQSATPPSHDNAMKVDWLLGIGSVLAAGIGSIGLLARRGLRRR